MFFIYLIENEKNTKKYVGQTRRTVKKRFIEHTKAKDKYQLHIEMKEYGKEIFHYSVIDTAKTQEEANEKEKYWIKEKDCINNGYNISPGGLFNFENINIEARSKFNKNKIKHIF